MITNLIKNFRGIPPEKYRQFIFALVAVLIGIAGLYHGFCPNDNKLNYVLGGFRQFEDEYKDAIEAVNTTEDTEAAKTALSAVELNSESDAFIEIRDNIVELTNVEIIFAGYSEEFKINNEDITCIKPNAFFGMIDVNESFRFELFDMNGKSISIDVKKNELLELFKEKYFLDPRNSIGLYIGLCLVLLGFVAALDSIFSNGSKRKQDQNAK